MVVKKRCLLWDYTNTRDIPKQMDKVNFKGLISSVSNWNAWVPPELKGRVPFRPMIHLERELNGNEWQFILNSDQPIIHFFNEPERNGISPQKAADYWHKQVGPTSAACSKKRKLTIASRWSPTSVNNAIRSSSPLPAPPTQLVRNGSRIG